MNYVVTVCHAEMNAILNKNQADIDGGTIYTTLYPCNECAKLIIQSGITKVVYANVSIYANSTIFITPRKNNRFIFYRR